MKNQAPEKNCRAQFSRLIEPHLEALFRLAWRLTGSRQDAEDLLQELVIKMYPRVDELAQIEARRPWLSRVLYRMFVDEHRRRQRSPVYLAIDNSEGDDESATPPIPAPSQPDSELELTQAQALLQSKLDMLSEDHRQVLLFHDVEGYSINEIGDILDCPEGTIKSRLHRGRARLRELLTEDGTFAPH